MSQILAEKLQAAFGRFRAGDLPEAERLCGEILEESRSDAGALHLLGVVRLMGGGADEAATLITRALEGSPGNPTMLEHLGLARLATRNFVAAETAFRGAILVGATHGLLYMRLGIALASQGKVADGLAALREAARRSPDDADVLLNLGNTLAEQGQHEEAVASYRRLAALQPRHPIVRFNLGTLYKNLGRWDEALAEFRQALEIAPDDPDTHNNLGIVHEQQGRLDEAASCYRRALAGNPRHAPALTNMGNVLRAQGRLDEAVSFFDQALAAAPGNIDAHVNLGIARLEQGQLQHAQDQFEQAARLDPRNADNHYNLGRVLKIKGEMAEAIGHFERALEAGARTALVHRELGDAFRQTGDFERAAQCYARAVDLEPRSADAHFDLGETLKLQGRLEEAIASYDAARALDPDHVPALGGSVHVRQHVCRWDGIENLWDEARRRIGGGAGGISPFSSLSMPLSAQEQLACARTWARGELAPVTKRIGTFDHPVRQPRDRLRIGYLSWGFHRHATAYLAAELFELHERRRVEAYAYAYGPDDVSPIRARIRDAAEHFVDVSRDSYRAIANRIHDDGIDVLVDLTGYTLGARPQVLALRPARVQVSWLGYPGTMGADCIDYIVADPFIIPEGREGDYAERVVRLPHCYQLNDRRREVSERRPTRADCGLPERGFVFCCFNQAYKVLPETFALWMRVLHAVPGSVLWLAEANPWAVANLRRAARAAGVAEERLVFAPRKPLPDYLAAYPLADLALDTYPYTSHTTASDALWMGCPLVTRAGDTFASRVAASILTSAGLARCVSGTAAEHEKMVVELASSPGRLEELRRATQAARDSALFDSARLVRDLEDLYERMAGIGGRP
jgi:predicted O-linked N-acetylglucosamine transferase (SPINDLY family)